MGYISVTVSPSLNKSSGEKTVREIKENFRFLLLEVSKQLKNALNVLEQPDDHAIRGIEDRDDYIDNLKSVIENASYSRAQKEEPGAKHLGDQLRALNIISSNLERIGDHAVNIVDQVRYFSDPAFIHRYDYKSCFHEIFDALDIVYDALFKQNMSLAFRICRTESNLDWLYKERFELILRELRSEVETGDLLTTLFIFRYLERIGDALLNIGEAIIFSITGNKFKIRQYKALRDSLATSGEEIPITEVEFESIWGTRSGARIGRVHRGTEDTRFQDVIFKDGNREKLFQESENIKRWEKILPGLAPKVVSQQEDAAGATLLIECLRGETLQDIVLTSDEDLIENALMVLERTVDDLWTRTMKPGQVNAHFIEQCTKRLGDVFLVHPDFRLEERHLCGVPIFSLQELLNRAKEIDRFLDAPFSVFIHGDFNTNNIIFNPQTQRLHYIDLHRSMDVDYLQDVSVFLVSNIRLPVFEPEKREKFNSVTMEFFRFAKYFAEKHEDVTFEARLCLGLIRSFLTSPRFEFNQEFAESLFFRGVYLLERIIGFEGPYEEFRLPVDVLTFGC
jgi:phosphate uptake regulator